MATSKAAVSRYKSKRYERIELRLEHGERATVQQAAQRLGQSTNAYIRAVILAHAAGTLEQAQETSDTAQDTTQAQDTT